MTYQHRELANGKWRELSLIEQLANIGSEVERTISWRSKNPEYSRLAFERALELIDLTLADGKNRRRCKEIARVREVLSDYFVGDNQWKSTDQLWRNYFYPFNYAARAHL
ncbi:MAG: hypothetical protein G01um101431_1050 [Parcubacteria group bacterium Gr01-1014_31]|nr:MAG: hypothetical protein G01um101431_1050 [Parcubacteria group bacterium Gr01-1014_31]